MKVLLIDDNETLIQIYQKILRAQGHLADILTDGTKAIETIKTSNPDIILLDLMMEPVSGWEILTAIRDDSEISDIPVIILTGKVLTIDEAVQYGLKIDGFVMKPLERSMLVTAVEEIWDIISECNERYERSIAAGLSEEKAQSCRNVYRKRKMLSYLRDLLIRQEKILNLRPDENIKFTETIEELRMIITDGFNNMAQEEATCP
ncbi:response regulator [uncultured Methanospirillum sp.]|uniref:response regulator n=1 Tax=uncultured Methanospirillum sp. TaxID=262503 RepID=UPI0029C67158|nr:response regulator [uncultured Methanospirillum sp.]